MSKFLISTSEVYRLDSEEETKAAIEEAKKDGRFILVKYTSEYKEKTKGGEVIDAYYKLTLNKNFNDIKEPSDSDISIEYKQGAF